MSPEWMEWIEENMPAAMLEEFKAAWRHEGNWRDNRIAALEAELAEFKTEANRTYERLRRHAAYQHKRAVEHIDEMMQAEAERDEARARCAAQSDALFAAIQAINDAEILMPDEVLDFTSCHHLPDRRWRPISEAPRDGTHILAWDGCDAAHHFGNHPPTVVHWFEDGYYTSVNELAPERPYPAVVWTMLHEQPAQEAALAECGEGKL